MSTISSIPPAMQPQQALAAPSISIQDLQNLLIVVDLATQRGAFRGPELSQVGALFDKINQFVQSAMPADAAGQQDNAQAAAPPAPTPVMPMTPPFAPKAGA